MVCFGYAVDRALQYHHHKHKDEKVTSDYGTDENSEKTPTFHWVWWSSDRKFWHELGFVAGFAQLCGATIFWISGFTGIPEVLGELEGHAGALDGAFWVPQVVGGTGFIISSCVLYSYYGWFGVESLFIEERCTC